jgi:hypothetical protein
VRYEGQQCRQGFSWRTLDITDELLGLFFVCRSLHNSQLFSRKNSHSTPSKMCRRENTATVEENDTNFLALMLEAL